MEQKKVKKDYRLELTDKIIAALENGTAPWQKPWDNSVIEPMMPFNPVSGTAYRGGNIIGLMMQGYQDPRWCTYKQAQAQSWQVRKGEKSSTVEYWKFEDVVERTDEKTGEIQNILVPLERPRVFYASVFNVSQMDNVPEIDRVNAGFQWEPMEMAEHILQRSGVQILHDQNDRAFYSILNDEVHLPPRMAFNSPMNYYATALHEIGHSTAHSSRLGRELGKKFGSVEYAKEELRAEMASLFLSYRLGIPHDVGQHASYVGSWIKVLKEDKNELFRAAKDAEQITEYVMKLALSKEYEQEKEAVNERITLTKAFGNLHEIDSQQTEGFPISEILDSNPGNVEKKRRYLNVPFSEKEQAKLIGAKWDKEQKSWFVPEEIEPEAATKLLQRWAGVPLSISSQVIEKQFSDALLSSGLVVNNSPIMDGKWHRTTVLTSSNKKALKGAYIANLDGDFANGFIQNFDTGYAEPWFFKGSELSAEQRNRFKRQAAENHASREKELAETQKRIAECCAEKWEALPDAKRHPYLDRKRVPSFGLKIEGDNLVTPLRDVDGKIWSLQYISADPKKCKLYEKGGRKSGNFHVIGNLEGAEIVLFAEGYATCASLHMSTQLPVIEVFDSGNINSVLRELGPKLGNIEKIICADDDAVTFEKIKRMLNNPQLLDRFKLVEGIDDGEIRIALGFSEAISLRSNPNCTLHFSYQEPEERNDDLRVIGKIINTDTKDHQSILMNNVGMEKAWEAALLHGAKVAAPFFSGVKGNRKDFNDLHVTEGLDQVRAQISTVVDIVRVRSAAVKAAKVSIGEAVVVTDPSDNHRYSGKIVANAGLHAIQDIGKQTAVAHQIVKLDKVPVLGAKALIEYEHGRGIVKLGISNKIIKER